MSQSVTVEQMIERITRRYDGLVVAQNWGETGLFYNPDNRLPKGVYFLTFKEKDGPNDKSSNINRDGVYRINLGIEKATFTQLFGALPARPSAGGVVDMAYDFAMVDKIMPHPVYAWFAWVVLLSPSEESYKQLVPLIEEGYKIAVRRYAVNIKKRMKRCNLQG